jgi:phosphatidate cytidylyltransferase
MSKNLTKRIIVAVVGIPALIFIIYKGGFFLYGFCLLVSFLGTWELAAMMLSKKIQLDKRPLTLLSLAVVSLFQFSPMGLMTLLAIFLLFVAAALLIAAATRASDFTLRLSLTLLAAMYPAFFVSFSILIRGEFGNLGWAILLFTFVNMWLADTFAYAFGVRFGKRKMTPRISPNKTWIGFIFAFPGGALAALAAYYYLDGALNLTILLAASVAATFFGHLGDTVESAIKRDCGAKDSSSLIPGHGGVLDRFDSLLFALPAVYFTFRLFG